MTPFKLSTTTHSADETRELGAQLAARLKPGDVVLLAGDLGAGKTQFSQGVAAGLGVAEVPISPTFNIVISYGSGRMPLHHFDLYRLDNRHQLEDIGLGEYLESGGVCLVEWAEKFPDAFVADYSVEIRKIDDESREVVVSELSGSVADGGASLDASGSALRGGASLDASSSRTNFSAESGQKSGFRSSSGLTSLNPSTQGGACSNKENDRFVLAFDTANEVVALGVGKLLLGERGVQVVATREIAAHRASNTTLVPAVNALLSQLGIARSQIACVCVGRGPGSFTGVRICMAAAKGIAAALGVGLVGVSTLDAIAWNAWAHDVRGDLLVLADAMRKEVYPARFTLSDSGIERLTADYVVKAATFAEEPGEPSFVAGDGLVKYLDLFESAGTVLSDKLWEVTGAGLLLAFQAAWQAGKIDPLDAARHDPGLALPVYTRLSDAEENERIKLARSDKKNLRTGVQDVAPDGGIGRETMHSQAHLVARAGTDGVSYRPLDASHVEDVAALEAAAMGTDAWSPKLVAEELGQRNRTWWIAEHDGAFVGYAGGLVVDGDVQILKIAVAPEWRRCGIARALLLHVVEDARNLGASTCSLEVRASNSGAQAFYAALGLSVVGTRPRYYSDREDAVIMQGPLPTASHDVAGMTLQHLEGSGSVAVEEASLDASSPRANFSAKSGQKSGSLGSFGLTSLRPSDRNEANKPLILAIESSCDETAAAIVDGEGRLLSDVVASQIDFHARFGGVVPEIASRKHIEAICGVCAEALETAGLRWSDLDSVAVTYAPGLLGALVVGVAFAKGAAWALDVPLVGVNHLEGHLYANKIGAPDFAPPAVVSLVSGGNTMLVHMRDWGDYTVLGETIDDAVGEAFDKVAKALGLGYPGGPAISKAASAGSSDAISFPRAMLHSHDLRFSLSGLKTAVVNYINDERNANRELDIPDIAASFQQAVIDVQVAKAKKALQQTGAPTFCLGGGVAANPALRAAYEKMCTECGVRLIMPPLSSCGDNAGMIALVALDRFRAGKFFALDADARAHTDLAADY